MRDIGFARPRGNMMRLKKPRLLNLAAGVSLLLAIVIVVAWVRSRDRYEGIVRFWHTSTHERSLVDSIALQFTEFYKHDRA